MAVPGDSEFFQNQGLSDLFGDPDVIVEITHGFGFGLGIGLFGPFRVEPRPVEHPKMDGHVIDILDHMDGFAGFPGEEASHDPFASGGNQMVRIQGPDASGRFPYPFFENTEVADARSAHPGLGSLAICQDMIVGSSR